MLPLEKCKKMLEKDGAKYSEEEARKIHFKARHSKPKEESDRNF